LEQLFSTLFSLHRGTTHYGDWVIACLQGAWLNLVGERLAVACRPIRFENSELTVEILEKSWEDAIKNLKPELLSKLQAATACEFRSIKVVCDKVAS
jgi:hypothetical protein